ncbi:MAG: DUF6198 family protein [Eubacteriales bacterium]|nr:DUF6198 family protein [Eubacteriales bacterium]
MEVTKITKGSFNLKVITRKSVLMLLGIFISSLGVCLSLKSRLGATPIGVCPAVFSQPLKISTGTAMGLLLAIFFLIQIVLLKKEFAPIQLFQLLLTGIYGFSVDIVTKILSLFPDELLWQRLIYCTMGIVILAFGVFIMLKTDFIMLPQDAVVSVICKKYNWEYGKVKIISDSILTVIAAVVSLILYNKLVHVGFGTILAALFVGKIISKLKEVKTLNIFVDRIIGDK